MPKARRKDITDVLRGQYWLARVVFLRCLGFVYAAAFLSALRDNGALVSCSSTTYSRIVLSCRISTVHYTFAAGCPKYPACPLRMPDSLPMLVLHTAVVLLVPCEDLLRSFSHDPAGLGTQEITEVLSLRKGYLTSGY